MTPKSRSPGADTNRLFPQLVPHINRPLSEKLEQTREIIRHHLEPGHFDPKEQVVAWSGGFGSTVVLYLIREQTQDVPVMFEDTGVEYPETYRFIDRMEKEWNLELIRTKPYKKNFWQCVKEYGYPAGKSERNKDGTRKSPKCCYYLKERPAALVIKERGFKAVSLGIQAIESRQRQIRAIQDGVCKHLVKGNYCKVTPILYWTAEDAREFARLKNIPHNTIYDKGEKRCGCMPCTAFSSWKTSLQNTNPKMYRKIMRDMGQELIS